MDEHSRIVSVIIPNYNRKSDLERLLPSIANQTFGDYEVIIIDDFSPDRSAVEYTSDFIRGRKNMRLVENTENIGFVKTCNKGIKLCTSKYICILTNDTEVTNSFIQRNVEIMDADDSIGVLSCIIVDDEGKNWFSGGIIKAGFPINLRDDFIGVRLVDYVAGTAPFYRREVFERVGLLNEVFYMYNEDVEFCLRLKRATDYKTCVFGEKLVTHLMQAYDSAPNMVFYYCHRNHIMILKRYYPKYVPKVMLDYLKETVKLVIIAALRLRISYFKRALYIVRGTLSGLVKGY